MGECETKVNLTKIHWIQLQESTYDTIRILKEISKVVPNNQGSEWDLISFKPRRRCRWRVGRLRGKKQVSWSKPNNSHALFADVNENQTKNGRRMSQK